MNRSGAAERQDRDATKILTLLDRVHPRRGCHVLIDQLVNARSGVAGRQAETVGNGLQRGVVGGEVEVHVATEEVLGIEHSEREVGVGHRRPRAAAAVTRRPWVGAGGFRTDLQQSELIDARQASATGADLDQVDRRHGHRKAGALLEPVHARHFKCVGDLRLAADDQARLGRGAPHVEAQQSILAAVAGEPTSGQRTGCGAALDQSDRSAGRVVGRHDTPVRQHHQHRAAESLRGEPFLQFVEVRPDHRHGGGVARRRDHPRVLADLWRDLGGDAHRHAEFAAQVLGDQALIGRIGVGVDQTYADCLHLGVAQRSCDRIDVCGGRRLDDRAEGIGALGDLDDAIARYGRIGEFDLQVVHVVAMLVADQHRVREACGRDDTGATDLAFDQSIGDERRGVNDGSCDVGGSNTSLDEQLAHSGAHTIERCGWRGERLFDDHSATGRVDQHDVSERSADVDGQTPVGGDGAISHCEGRLSGARRRRGSTPR